MADHLLQENGDALLQESGSQILLVPGVDAPFTPVDMARVRAFARAAVVITTIVTRPSADATTPFAQADWPRPQPKQHLVHHRAFTYGPPPDTIPGAAAAEPPFIPVAWPVPARSPRLDLSFGANLVLGRVAEALPVGGSVTSPPTLRRGGQTWTQNLLQSTLAPTETQPFNQFAWPRPAFRVQRDRTFGVSLVTSTLDQAPFSLSSWPRPHRAENRDRSYGANLVLGRVAEALPVGRAGLSTPGFRRQPPPFDWAPNLLLLQAPPVVQPFIPVAWPKPQRSKPQPPPFDWAPNLVLRQVAEAVPVGRSAESRQTRRRGGETWAQNLLQTTLAEIAPPFVPTLFPPPQASLARPAGHQFQPLLTLAQAPFRLDAWPVPGRRTALPDRSAVPNLLVSTLAQVDLPFALADWPAPQVRRPRFAAQGPNLVLVQVAEPLPFNQHQWPRPAQWRWSVVNPSQDGGLRMPLRALFVELLASRTLYGSLTASRTSYADLLASRTLYDDLLAGE